MSEAQGRPKRARAAGRSPEASDSEAQGRPKQARAAGQSPEAPE